MLEPMPVSHSPRGGVVIRGGAFSWGHMKTECMLILIWVMFDSALTVKIILGMLLTLFYFFLL
uniref:Uncharacterized protein n=1 Tax=Oryza nivara TaxID=4536 RepID=A0A0E0HX13_ORYNI